MPKLLRGLIQLIALVWGVILGTSCAHAPERQIASEGAGSNAGLLSTKMFSPHRNIRVEINATGGEDATFTVWANQTKLLEPSKLGLSVAAPSRALTALSLVGIEHRSGVEDFDVIAGKSNHVRTSYEEYDAALLSPSGARLHVIFRVFDEGVAFRYLLATDAGSAKIAIEEELTAFQFPAAASITALQLDFGSSYEAYYSTGTIESFAPGKTLGFPLVVQAGSTWMALTESALSNYPGLYVEPAANGQLIGRLAPRAESDRIKAVVNSPLRTPWRVLMIGDSPGALIQSNLVTALADPNRIGDTSWIHLGKIQFPWWNGYVVPGEATRAGLNTWTLKHYIDFCAANGIPYHSLDGFEMDQAWYGGKVLPYEGADVTHVRDEIDLPGVLRYARERHVGTRVWLNIDGLRKRDLNEVFATYESWGVSGIMVDFVNRDDQDTVVYLEKILATAARHHLTVAFHGVYKPTGLSRTYPNLLNHEAVLGTEYDKWNKDGVPAGHEVMIAYVRMLAGPLDTHEGSFAPVARADFKVQPINPHAIGTLARQLAMYVVYENPLPMLADVPENYLARPRAFDFLKHVPVTWDETKFVGGEFGHWIALARRSGDEWSIGIMTDETARTVEVDLSFLASGKYSIETWTDDTKPERPNDQAVYRIKKGRKPGHVRFHLRSAGGAALRVRKIER